MLFDNQQRKGYRRYGHHPCIQGHPHAQAPLLRDDPVQNGMIMHPPLAPAYKTPVTVPALDGYSEPHTRQRWSTPISSQFHDRSRN